MKSSAKNIRLASYDDIFKPEEADSLKDSIKEIPLTNISDFKNHPFHVQDDTKMDELVESIRKFGVITPALVRPQSGRTKEYEMIAGHRRKRACEKAGLFTMPCIVKDLDDDTATIFMVDSNRQREHILPSEKAFAYKMQLEAIKHQGQRDDLTDSVNTSGTVCQKYSSREQIAESNGESSRNIQNYIRLTLLIKPLLDMVDEGRVPFRAGVSLSYLTQDNQTVLFEYISYSDFRISIKQSEIIKSICDGKTLDKTILDSVFFDKVPKPKKAIRLPMNDIRSYFRGMEDDEITKQIIEIVRLHFQNR